LNSRGFREVTMLVDVLRDDGLAPVEARPASAAPRLPGLQGLRVNVIDICASGLFEGMGLAFATGQTLGIAVGVRQ
jgi:hypothetical protein